jgi:glc operon protein GlcG
LLTCALDALKSLHPSLLEVYRANGVPVTGALLQQCGRSFLSEIKTPGASEQQAPTKGREIDDVTLTTIALGAGLLVSEAAFAQQQPAAPVAPPNLDAIHDKMPFATPYGAPITMDRAQAAIQAAVAEANKRGWALNVTVVDPNGDLVAFARMDGAQLASIAISQHKARTAARYRRPTHAFEDGVTKAGLNYLLTLDNVIASRGGVPLIEGGKLIGAIGCSGGTGSQDETICTAGANTINK